MWKYCRSALTSLNDPQCEKQANFNRYFLQQFTIRWPVREYKQKDMLIITRMEYTASMLLCLLINLS